MARAFDLAEEIRQMLIGWGVVVVVLVIPLITYFFVEKRKKWWAFWKEYERLVDIYKQAKKKRLDRATADEFSTLVVRCSSMLSDLEESGDKDEVWLARSMVQKISLFVASYNVAPDTPASEEIAKLAELRKKGMISDHEFQAFSERFKVSTGEKAMGIIQAIASLHSQYEAGAMSESNYHASLWSLMDKLDRKV